MPTSTPPADHALLQDRARDHLLLHFTRHGTAFADPRGASERELLVLERGEGPYVFDTRGRRYVDALSSLYCAQLGYSHGEEFSAAIAGQLATLPFNTNWGTAHPAAIELAHQLAERTPGDLDHVFLTNGGSESVEAMWKIAREHFRAIGQPRRTKAIARDIAYHGVTLGALSFTGVPGYKEGFGTPPIDVTHVSNTNAFRGRRPDEDDATWCARLLQEVRDAVAAAGPDEVAVIIAEPVQNAGGCLVPPPGYWAGLRGIADEHGILLVADSVICGFGRLGSWLGIEHEGVVPDMVTTAKGITSAYLPGGAVFVRDHVAASLSAPTTGPLRHGITFGGHPAGAAAALKNIEIFEREGILPHVRALEGHLAGAMGRLLELPLVGDVRGAGFFRAAELVGRDGVRLDQAQRDELLRGFLPGRLLEAGLIARADDRGDAVVQIAPPLIADAALLDEIVDRLGEVLADAGEHLRRFDDRRGGVVAGAPLEATKD
ncbi:aminotransferase class III-fold pyridoxal phosphate-dependent enzyme [Patulibacter brassicae]|uniref:Aminotransferase class III-fold pyridoxal phosphate-dependent enzyme n=1 Tax=Patulibacter brassicae TaxID=1705717 RepID=A0ABU4VPM0_9ACTN|nr:aminotransferase class III-fold pyridoxal phosphate-dependent enzyme [Patulibacter brassicae]MDX8153802.1 aminotransferase class III-fold pyridoxal phosphate-dependent enzyme [Patulibacter brassicae]